MTRSRRPRLTALLLGVLLALVASGCAAAGGDLTGPGMHHLMGQGSPACPTSAPTAGTIVHVVLADMGRHPGPSHVTAGRMPQRMSHRMQGAMLHGRMLLTAFPRRVSAGQVTFVATNRGARTHELVVLPLGAHARIGQRALTSDRAVDEASALGEASATCAPGTGDGLAPGSAGWTTLTLSPGRYELVCNRPGHYAAGMYAELVVVG